MKSTLLTVSGTIPPDLHADIESGRRPRADYLELADAMDADLLDQAEAKRALGPLGRLVGRIVGDDLVLAYACFRRRRRYRVVFTDGEQVGLPYAAMTWMARRRPAHVMIGHRLSARKKRLLQRALRLHRRVDRLVVYASAQRRCAIEQLGYEPRQVRLVPFMVDTEFWRREQAPTVAVNRPMICAAGQEWRDYPTMVDAVTGLDVDVRIAAISPWSKRPDSSAGLVLPSNVEARGYNLFELRQLYADAELVVVPLEATDFQAGITTILEAMSMSKAVVCTGTEGQTDTLIDGDTGVHVPTGDARALRRVIEDLLADLPARVRLGERARAWVCAHADIATYAVELAAIADAAGCSARGRGEIGDGGEIDGQPIGGPVGQ